MIKSIFEQDYGKMQLFFFSGCSMLDMSLAAQHELHKYAVAI